MSELLGAAPGPEAALIKDATIESFENDVLEASMTMPIIVDFWADWCGPCKQLAPVLEKAVAAAGGTVRLVKVDIDKNQMLASQLRIQSVPTVYAFYQGRPVDGFQGSVPESEIKAFIERLNKLGGDGAEAGPASEEILTAADAAFAAGDVSAAAQAYSQIAQAEPENLRALGGLARCHLQLGDHDKAQKIFDLVPEESRDDPAVAGIAAALSLAAASAGAEDMGALSAKIDQNTDDFEARFELAGAQIAAGDLENGMDQLLAIIERDASWNEEEARKKLLTVFEALGGAHPATIRGRRRLSSLLFS